MLTPGELHKRVTERGTAEGWGQMKLFVWHHAVEVIRGAPDVIICLHPNELRRYEAMIAELEEDDGEPQ